MSSLIEKLEELKKLIDTPLEDFLGNADSAFQEEKDRQAEKDDSYKGRELAEDKLVKNE